MMNKKQKNLIKKALKELKATQIEQALADQREQQFALEIRNVFAKMEKDILANLDLYWNDGTPMFQAHRDLILAPIHEYQKEYNDIINKYVLNELEKGRQEAIRVVKRKRQGQKSSFKAWEDIFGEKPQFSYGIGTMQGKYADVGIIYPNIENYPKKEPPSFDDRLNTLFGTDSWSQDKLENMTFVASQRTLNRVDDQINQILVDGYVEGWGQNGTAKKIMDKYAGFKDWEAKRIARTELHWGHNQGLMVGYIQMDVEYIEWNCHVDGRQRDSHEEQDGTIVRKGDNFKNGQKYPGDRGIGIPLSEFINCRCVAMPFIMPPGKMAPSFSPFREGDLIDVEMPDIEQIREYQEKKMANTNLVLDRIDKMYPDLNQIIDDIDLSEFGLGPFEGLNYKRGHMKNIWAEIRNEIVDVGYENWIASKKYDYIDQIKYAKLHIRDVYGNIGHHDVSTERKMELAMFKRIFPQEYDDFVKQIDFSPYIKDYDLNKLTPRQREVLRNINKSEANNDAFWQDSDSRAYFENLRDELEAIARDKNLYVEEVEVDLTRDYNGFQMGSSTYQNLKKEKFYRYNFLDKNYSIYISEGDLSYDFNPYAIREELEKNESLLEDSFKRIFVSSQKDIYSPQGGHYVGGWSDTRGNIITFDENFDRFKQTLAHEGGHNIDGLLGGHTISGDSEYEALVRHEHDVRRSMTMNASREPDGTLDTPFEGLEKGRWWADENGDIHSIAFDPKTGKWFEVSSPSFSHFNPQDVTQVWITSYAETKRYPGSPDLVEDWAESVTAFVNDKEYLKKNYPLRYEYIDKLFKTYERTGKLELPNDITSKNSIQKTAQMFQNKLRNSIPRIHEIEAPPDPKDELRRVRRSTWKQFGLHGIDEDDLDTIRAYKYYLDDDFKYGGVKYVEKDMKPKIRALLLKSWDEGQSSSRSSKLKLFTLKKYFPHYYKKWTKEVADDLDDILNNPYDAKRLTPAQWNQLKSWKKDEQAYLDGKDDIGWWESVKDNVEKQRKEFKQALRDENLIAEDYTCDWNSVFGPFTKKEFPELENEQFIAYRFKDRDYTIYISTKERMFEYNPYEIRDIIDSQPPAIQDSLKRVFISTQKTKNAGGFADQRGNLAIFTHDRSRKYFKAVLSHEGGHSVDSLFEKGIHGISGDTEYIRAVELDHDLRRNGDIQIWWPNNDNDSEYEMFRQLGSQNTDDYIWISKYAETKRYDGSPDLVEDWAESVSAYVHTPRWFKSNYPNTYRYIDDVFRTYERTGKLKLPKGRLTNRSVTQTTMRLFDQKVKQPLMSAPKKKSLADQIPKRTSDDLSDEERKLVDEKKQRILDEIDQWEAYQFESKQEAIDDQLEMYEEYIEDYMWHSNKGYGDHSNFEETWMALEELFPEETAGIRKKFTKAKDLKRLSPAQREAYDKLMDLKKSDPELWKKLNKENGNKFKDKLSKYNKIIKDRTIRTKQVTLDLGDSSNHIGENSIPTGTTEDFTLYEFTDLNCEIYISNELKQPGVSAQSIREYLLEAPRIEREKYKRIAVSSKEKVEIVLGTSTDKTKKQILGWSDSKGNVFMVNNKKDEFFVTLDHEGGHNIDGDAISGRQWSISEAFVNAHDEDVADLYNGVRKRKPLGDPNCRHIDTKLQILDDGTLDPQKYEGPFVSAYGENDMMSKISASIKIHGAEEMFWDDRMVEEWAECFSVYRKHPKWLKENYPRTYKVIDDMVKYYEDPNHYTWKPMPGNNTEKSPSVVGKVSDMLKGPTNKVNKVFYETVPDSIKPKGYDKYKLTTSEKAELKKLEKKDQSEGLKFGDRTRFKKLKRQQEFSDLYNKKITVGLEGDEIGDYRGLVRMISLDKRYRKVTNRVNKKKYSPKMFNNKDAFKLTKKQEEVFEELKYEKYQGDDLFDPFESNEYDVLSLQKRLDELHRKALGEGLDEYETYDYITGFKKMKEYGIELPEISPNVKITTEKGYFERVYPESYYNAGNKYGLTKKQQDELYQLEKEELILGEGDTFKLNEIHAKWDPRKVKRITELRDQRDFNFLYYFNQEQKGLNYEKTKQYEELFDKFKDKFDLDPVILEQPISNYDQKIKFKADDTDFKKFKGTRDDGMLPGGEDIRDYFTIDPRDLTPRELDVAEEWLGSNYRAFTDFETKCGRDVEKFANYCVECYNKYQQGIDGNKYRYYQYYGTYERGLEFAKDIAHDMPVLDSIMDNQLKKGITLWRVQENHHLGDLEIGSIVEFANNRSASISKEGALWFEATNGKPMKYLIEIEAPTGTKGCYLAPIKKGTWYGQDDHPCAWQEYAHEMEDLLKKSKVRIEKVYKKKVKGLTGNELTHIKVRIVESG